MTEAKPPDAPPVKILLVGDSGSGKTGALASLARAGYNLRIMDFDNGTEILKNLLGEEFFKQKVSVMILQDHRVAKKVPVTVGQQVIGYNVRAIPAKASAWQKAVDSFFGWKPPDGPDLGSIYDWTSRDVFVLDSITHAWRTALSFVLAINNRPGQQPTQPEWGTVQGMIIDVLSTLFDSGIKCNVVVCAHIAYNQDQNEIIRGLPSGPGQAINKDIGTYFNHTLRCVTVGKQHRILTETDGVVELKTAAPGKVKRDYPIETGLADYFKDI